LVAAAAAVGMNQSAQPQVQSLLAMPCPPMTEDMVAALLRTNDLLIGVQSLHQSVLQGEYRE